MNLIARAACLLAFASTTVLAATVAPAPPTMRGEAFDIIQGVRVADPYRWLEDANDPKVQAWSDGHFDSLSPGRDLSRAPRRPR